MLYKIEQPIYPIELYLHIGKDLSESLSNFISTKTNLPCNDNFDNCYGVVYRDIYHKDTKSYSLVIAFEGVTMNNGFIVHELTHLVNRLYEHIGQSNYGDENNAYLMEYLFNQVEKYILQYKELNKE